MRPFYLLFTTLILSTLLTTSTYAQDAQKDTATPVSGDDLRHLTGTWHCEGDFTTHTGADLVATKARIISLEHYDADGNLYVNKTSRIIRGDDVATYHIDTKRLWYVSRINDSAHPTLYTTVLDIPRFNLASSSNAIEDVLMLKNYLETQQQHGDYESAAILELTPDTLVLGSPWHSDHLSCKR